MSHPIRILALACLAATPAMASGPQSPPVRRGYTIPLLDLADQKQRQVVVDREPGQYLGHPTTVLLEDGKTILAAYPEGHGRGAIVLKQSTDGGLTWSERLPVPENWSTSQETADFQARLDWCIKPYDEANHPPVVRIRGERERAVAPGEVITLDASGTTDPDGDGLNFEWSIYQAKGHDSVQIAIQGRGSKVARLRAPEFSERRMIPILLSVRDEGSPRLMRYGRVLVTVMPEN